MKLLRGRLTPAIVVALVALAAALSGVSAASAGKPGKAHAARAQRGPRGFRGPRGYRGPQGPAGVVPQILIVQSPSETLNPGQTTFDVDPNGFKATCPTGYTVIGTGFNGSIGNTYSVQSYGGFFVGGFVANNSSIQISPVYLQAMCGAVPHGATAASAGASRIAMEAKYRKQLNKLERTARRL